MYRHIMYRGKNTSVVCRGHMRAKHVRTHRKKRTTRTRRDAPRHVSTLRAGVCRVKHCRVGHVASHIVVSKFAKTTNKGQFYNITTTLQKDNKQQRIAATCGLAVLLPCRLRSIRRQPTYLQYSFRPAIHKRPLYPRHAKLVLLLLCLAR